MEARGRPLKVLVVEDESVVAMLVEDVLAELGHQVIGVAPTLKDALRAATELEFDLAVIDVNLNGERSYPIAEILRAKRLPFVFLTGYGALGLDEQWRNAAVVQKPFEIDDLEAAIERALSA